MKRFVLKVAVLAAPVVAIVLLELFVLPLDAFTYRAWEALSVYRLKDALPGPFYPDRSLSTLEEGDLGRHSRFAVRKRNTWRTDAHGFRFHGDPRPADDWDVVIVGDSFTVGSGLDGPDMLDRALARRSGLSVYPYAPRSLNDFLNDPRFGAHGPRFVLLELAESGTDAIDPPLVRAAPSPRRLLPATFAVFCDRFLKAPFLHWIQAVVQDRLVRAFEEHVLGRPSGPNYYAQLAGDGSMLFDKNGIDRPERSESELFTFARTLTRYQTLLKARGEALAFLPVPSKATAHYRSVPMAKPDNLARLIIDTRRQGIPTVDLVTPFQKAALDARLYQEDDTHWNRAGVERAADAIAPFLTDTRER